MRLGAPSDTRYHPSRKAPTPLNAEKDEESQKEKPKGKRRGLCQKVDTTGILTVFLGPPVLLIGLTFLILFWWESMNAINGSKPEAYWFRIVDADWAIRLVTICTTSIRAVLGFQAGLATAMIAGVVLEMKGIPLLQTPLYSILRAVKVAPSSIFTATNFKPRLPPLIYTLVTVEVLVTAASQFLSTIYLSDFSTGTFTQSSNSTNISLLDTGLISADAWWSMPPAANWVFAELSDSFEEGPGYHDTGHTFRAFLPFEEESQRTTLRELSGPIPIMDHRVICASPTLVNLTLNVTDQSYVRLSGDISTKNLSYPLLMNTSHPSFRFSCKLPSPMVYEEETANQTSLCWVTESLNWTVLGESPLVQPDGYPVANVMFIILDILSMASVVRVGKNIAPAHAAETQGPWTIVTHGNDRRTLRVSACLTNMAMQTTNVVVNSSSDNPEPYLSWDRSAQGYTTEAARRQLGASRTKMSLASRGVLTLEPRSQWGAVLPLKDTSDGTDMTPFFMAIITALPIYMISDFLSLNPGVILAFSGIDFIEGNAHLTQVSMFQDTLNATASPALALQVLLARVYQMVYYQQLVKLDSMTAATTAFSFSASIPVQWTGFTIGMALIVTHLIIVSTITIYFVKFTDSSFIGNYWQPVSQIISMETHQLLEQADRMDDQELKRWAKRNRHDLKTRRILHRGHDGRITLDIAETSREI